MAHTVQTVIWFALVFAALGAGQLFVVAAIIEMVQRRLQGRELNWAFVATSRRNGAGFH